MVSGERGLQELKDGGHIVDVPPEKSLWGITSDRSELYIVEAKDASEAVLVYIDARVSGRKEDSKDKYSEKEIEFGVSMMTQQENNRIKDVVRIASRSKSKLDGGLWLMTFEFWNGRINRNN